MKSSLPPWVNQANKKGAPPGLKKRDPYNNRRWKAVSVAHRESFPDCAECARNGKDTPAAETDHIIPLVYGGAMYDVTNLQGLCKSCHSTKTGREERGALYEARRNDSGDLVPVVINGQLVRLYE